MLSIVWVNRGPAGDTDAFGATYGVNAALARSIVDLAINDWNRFITDFNYDGDGNPATANIFALTLNAGAIAGNGVTFGWAIDGAGLPTAATITLDDNAGGTGWFFDPTPEFYNEFTTVITPFEAEFPTVTAVDFYRTASHEIGHAVGIATAAPALAFNGFFTPAGVDQNSPPDALNVFQNAGGAFGVQATVTANGGGHLYEGPPDPAFPAALIHPNDLMTAGRNVNPIPPVRRRLISDLDVQILRDAYGYTINGDATPDAGDLPQRLHTLHASRNAATGELLVFGSTQNDTINIDLVDGGANIRVRVNYTDANGNAWATEDRLSLGGTTRITVNAGGGNDNLTINFGGGNPIPAGGLTYDGQGQAGVPGDTLTLGGGTFNTVAHTFTSPDSGTVNMDGSVITYAGLEPIADNLGAANRVFTMAVSGSQLIRLHDNAFPAAPDGDGLMTIDSTGGGFEAIVFVNPTNTLTINAGDRDDQIQIISLDTTAITGGLRDITVNGEDGNDTLVVNTGTGLFTLPDGIRFHGGQGFDTLTVTGAPAINPITNVIFTPGPDVSEGRLDYQAAGGASVMLIDYLSLEPVIDLLPAPTLTVNGTPADDVINIERGPAGAPVQGQVTVNNLELIDFANKTNLVVNGAAGSDVINVNLSARPAGLTGITINADGPANSFPGNDRVTILSLPLTGTGFTGPLTVNAGPGDDCVDGSALIAGAGTPALTLNGDAGNDTLIGGCAADTINGGAGDDTLAGGPDVTGIANTDTFDGGAGWDTIVVSGTGTTDGGSWNDVIDVFQQAPNGFAGGNFQLRVAVNAPPVIKTITQTSPLLANTTTVPPVLPTVEEVRIEAGAGDDLIRVGVADEYTDTSLLNGFPEQTLRITVHGDQPNASDRLVVQDDKAGDLILYRKGTDGRSGSVHVAPALLGVSGQQFAVAPVVFDGIERVDFFPLTADPVGSANFGTGTNGAGRVVVFESDPFEWNDVRQSATTFDFISRVAVHPTIDPGGLLNPFGDEPAQGLPGDEDWYQFTATKTSTFQFNLLFETIASVGSGADLRPGLPGDGALQLQLFQADTASPPGLTPIGTARPLLGTRMAPFAPIVGGTAPAPDGNSIVGETGLYVSASVQQGQAYWLRVSGALPPVGALVSTATNLYDLEAVETDVIGPQITKVAIWDQATASEVDYNLFDHKDAEGHPARVTPLVNALTINVRDLVGREELPPSYGALNLLVADNPGHYRLVGDANGVIPILDVVPINDPAPVPFVVTGAVNAAVAGAINAAAGAWNATAGFYNGWTFRITSGALDGWQTVVTGYTPGPTPTFNFAPGSLTAALPAAGDSFELRAPATGRIILTFAAPLPDDRYTLTVEDSILDIPGNRLDGENNAIEPHLNPVFPTGDFVSGGDFVARFTVDSRPEIGTWSAGSVYVDTNGNLQFDPTNLDYTNRDLTYVLGFTTDDVFAGKFYLGGPADGFDRLAAYGRVNIGGVMTYRWLITSNSGVPSVFGQASELNGLPVAGNFGAGAGDEVGVFVSSPTTAGGTWYLDGDGNFNITTAAPDRVVNTPNMKGFPIVGDFDGDGFDDLGVYNETSGSFLFRLTNGVAFSWATRPTTVLNVGTLVTGPVGFPGVRERPVAADMDMDGIDDVGLWVPDRAGVNAEHVGEWYFWISNRNRPPLNVTPVPGTVNTLNHYFSPRPLGQDLFARFGNEFALPVVGNFDPPPDVSSWTPPPQTGPVELRFSGTPGDDTFAFSPGQLPGTWIVDINGYVQTVSAEQIKLEFDGLGGRDAATLTGTNTVDEASLKPSQGALAGVNYTVTVANVESITVDGKGGEDTVNLNDSRGDDTLTASPTQTKLSGSGFSLTAADFEWVYAYASKGSDTASLYDSPGNDLFTADPKVSRLTGPDFSIRVKFFDAVHAYSLAGGVDTAKLTGSSGSDKFTVSGNVARMIGSSFMLRAKAFEVLNAYGGGGADVALLYDTVLKGPMKPSLAGTLGPSPYTQTVWLRKFAKVQQINQPSMGGLVTYKAIDKIFAAYR